MTRDELTAWLRLTLTPGVGNESTRKLLAAFGPPEAVFQQSNAALSQVVSPKQALALQRLPDGLSALLETTWNWLSFISPSGPANPLGLTRQVVALGDAAYPQSLLNIEDPPLMLYLQGRAAKNYSEKEKTQNIPINSAQLDINLIANICNQSIAVVGSRNPTAQGAVTAREFAHALCKAGLTVVSGLALGIDAAAHEGALLACADSPALGGSGQLATIAVVGTGLDRVYPSRHRDLAHRIAQNGLIVSEFPLGTPPLDANFPRRNRIIAGLAQGTLVVEAALKSGSLITARLAAEQGKEVFAIPGSIHSNQSRGCHALIRQGAKLVETVQDILEDLKIEIATKNEANYSISTGTFGNIEPTHLETALLEALGFDPVSLDALQARTGTSTADLQAQLMTLELDEKVARLPGGLFQRIVKT